MHPQFILCAFAPGYLCLACSSARCSSSWVEEQRRNWLRNSVVPRFLCTQLRLQQHDSQTGAEARICDEPEAYPEQWWELVEQDKDAATATPTVQPRDNNKACARRIGASVSCPLSLGPIRDCRICSNRTSLMHITRTGGVRVATCGCLQHDKTRRGKRHRRACCACLSCRCRRASRQVWRRCRRCFAGGGDCSAR